MKAHIEVRIQLKLRGTDTLHRMLRTFARETGGWSFPVKQSAEYQMMHGSPAGFVVCEPVEGLERAAVAIAGVSAKRPGSFTVANIVPRDVSHLALDQYNAIGRAFVRAFRKWLKMSSIEGSVRSIHANKTLTDIIPGKKCREHFDRFLKCAVWGANILPSHPSDIEKLDVFICALFRHGANVFPGEIERHLIVDRNWKPAEAAWIRTRIDTGLAVLRVNRRF